MEFNQTLASKLLSFMAKNIITIIAFSVLIAFIIHRYNIHLEREKYFDNGETFHTIAEVVHYKDQGKIGSSIGFSFFLNGIKIEDQPRDPLKNSISNVLGNFDHFTKHINNVGTIENNYKNN